MNKEIKVDKAYSGKIIYHGNKPYQLVPELHKGMCEGCSLYHNMGSEKSGKKNDFQDGKLRWDLLPLEEIEDIVKLYTAGSIKYGDNNWQGLENGYQRYKAAMLRHLLEYEKGTKIDEETKVNHLAAVAWNAIAMLYLDKHGKGKVNDNK